ncbi:MAG: DUF2279 domain-containing protein [Desulfobacula sp.]
MLYLTFGLFKRLFVLLPVFFLFFSLDLCADTRFSKEETVLLSNAIGFATITGWGILNWDYFQNDPKKADEGWFSESTKNGGVDKLGHFYFSYALSHLFSSLFEHEGYSSDEGAAFGSLSVFGLTTCMEIGDSFSQYGFSYEDAVMNLLGSLTGYLLYSQPDLADKIDFRIEYLPDFKKLDFTTDYENQKFLVALKFDGFDFSKHGVLKYFELHLGYYTRGYSEDRPRERNVYLGFGLNMSRIFNYFSAPDISKASHYIQIPYTYIEAGRDLNP